MVAGGRPSKATKLAGPGGPWSSHCPSPMPPSSSQASETDSTTFPAFEQDDNPAADGGPSNETPRQNRADRSRPGPSASRPQQKNNMAIPQFYTKPDKSKVHIIPHRRKGSSHRESTSLDLSISAVENEGLGIYANHHEGRRNADSFAAVASRTAHHRSSSGTSQYSTTTMPGMSAPGSQYIHPMRQIPRPYTPPLNRSNQTSTIGSEPSDGRSSAGLERPVIPSGREQFNYRSSSLGSRSHADSPHLASLQINEPGGTSSSHSRTHDSNNLHDSLSPVSRGSFDFAFRSKARTSVSNDPAARAAAVQAARQAFEDREAAKRRKFEKAQGKELRRKERKEQEQEQRQQQMQEQLQEQPRQPPPPPPQQQPQQQPQQPKAPRRVHLSDFTFRDRRHHNNNNNNNEKPSRPEDSAHRRSDPHRGTAHNHSEKRNSGSKFKSPKSAWLLFLTWLRTRIFKMRRKFKKKARG